VNYHFTDSTRALLAQAREEAIELMHDYVGTEHMLLALVDTVGRRSVEPGEELFDALGVDAGALRSAILESVRRGAVRPAPGGLPYTSRAKKVLQYGMSEARRRGDSWVGTEHLMLGLIREEAGMAAQALRAHGVTLEGAREALADVRSSAQERDKRPTRLRPRRSTRSAVEGGSVWFLEVDQELDTPLYEQIVARIEEAVATGRLDLGERLPSVRDLAAELGIAPGTVARAYSELETRGVVETEGAKGTRVAKRTASGRRSKKGVTALERALHRVVVAAFHRDATAEEMRAALERAMKGILRVL